jgi:hypothetical protein
MRIARFISYSLVELPTINHVDQEAMLLNGGGVLVSFPP